MFFCVEVLQNNKVSCFLCSKHDEGSLLSADHITKLVVCLRDNIRSPDKKQLTSGLLDLRALLIAATVPLNSLQAVLFSFQDAVGCIQWQHVVLLAIK